MGTASTDAEKYEELFRDVVVLSRSNTDINIAARELATAVKSTLVTYTMGNAAFNGFLDKAELKTLNFGWGLDTSLVEKTEAHYDEKGSSVFCSCILRKREDETHVRGFFFNSKKWTLMVELHFFRIKPDADSKPAKMKCAQLMREAGQNLIEAFAAMGAFKK